MSSFVRTIFENGITGPTGPTGPAGPIGPRGTDGSDISGPTGSSIIGITFFSETSNTHRLVFEYEDGSTKQSNLFNSGITGSWYVQFGASAYGDQFISNFSRNPDVVSGNPFTTTSDSLTLKTIHTNTPDKIQIQRTQDDLITVSYIGSVEATLSSENQNQIVIAVASDSFDGATNSNWNPIDNTLDWTISRYLEKSKSLTPGQGEDLYTINPKEASIFCLNGSQNLSINIEMQLGSANPTSESNSVILVIPRTTGLTGEFKISYNSKQVNIPLLIPKPKSGINVYVGLSVLGEWYFKCAVLGSSVAKVGVDELIGSYTFDPDAALRFLLNTCWNKTSTDSNWTQCEQFDLDGSDQISAADVAMLLGAWQENNLSFSLYSACTTIAGPSYERECIPSD
jgi:hypothetical protein